MISRHSAALAAGRASPSERGLARVGNYWILLYWLLLCLAIGWLYWPALCGEVPAFRDAFHFYYPLEYWLSAQSKVGQFMPHFNPWDGAGTNLVGETSGGLCYPGRVLWHLPGLAVEQRFGVVLAAHTLIAAVGASYAARRMRLSLAAACLAATAYALGGAVLFQHTNPVYLIGAAWTPWALAECWALVHTTGTLGADQATHSTLQPRMAVWVSATALMLLGGDPQATMHAGILAALAIVTRLVRTRSWPIFARQFLWLASAVVIVTGLTAAQWIPARYWLQQSQRVPAQTVSDRAFERAWELPELLRPLAESSQAEASHDKLRMARSSSTYAYSVAPWHLITLLWGTAGGHYLPEHTRWLQAVPGEPRMWTASLSIGLLPLLFIVAGWSRRSTRRSQRFLMLVAFVAAAAMLGSFAPVWLLRQACHAAGASQWANALPGDEVGGMYWCLTKLVPGYSAFRYPAKWSVWFACAMALSAASAFDRHRVPSRALARLCMFVGALSAVAAVVIACLQWLPAGQGLQFAIANQLAASSPDPWLGHPDAEAVLWLWLQAAVVATAVSTLCVAFIRLGGPVRRLRALVLILTLAEMVWAGNKWLVTVDVSRLDTGELAPVAATGRPGQPVAGQLPERMWASIGRANWDAWSVARGGEVPSRQGRLAQICDYQMQYRLGKLHLLRPGQANFSALMSLTPRSLSAVRARLARADDLRADNPALDQALAWLGVSQRLTGGARLRWHSIAAARPLVELIGERDVEPGANDLDRRCRIEHFGPDRLSLETSSPQATRLLLRWLQDGGWSAKLIPRGTPPGGLRAPRGAPATLIRQPAPTHLGLFQTLDVPAGSWSIELAYCAPGWRLGLGITLATLAAVLILSIGPVVSRCYCRTANRRAAFAFSGTIAGSATFDAC